VSYAALRLRDRRIDRAVKRASIPRRRRALTKKDIQIALLKAAKKGGAS
jgi:hypothetical protein